MGIHNFLAETIKVTQFRGKTITLVTNWYKGSNQPGNMQYKLFWNIMECNVNQCVVFLP